MSRVHGRFLNRLSVKRVGNNHHVLRLPQRAVPLPLVHMVEHKPLLRLERLLHVPTSDRVQHLILFPITLFQFPHSQRGAFLFLRRRGLNHLSVILFDTVHLHRPFVSINIMDLQKDQAFKGCHLLHPGHAVQVIFQFLFLQKRKLVLLHDSRHKLFERLRQKRADPHHLLPFPVRIHARYQERVIKQAELVRNHVDRAFLAISQTVL